MILYIKDPNDATKQKTLLINIFSKISEHKIQAQNSEAFLLTNDKQRAKKGKQY